MLRNIRSRSLSLLQMQNLWRKKLYKVWLDQRILPRIASHSAFLEFILPVLLTS